MRALIITVALLAPALAFAQGAQTLQGVLNIIGTLIKTMIPIAASLALLAFIWGLAMYLFSFSGKDEDKKKGRDIMVWGIIAMFVIFTIAGIVALLKLTFRISGGNLTPPTVNVNTVAPAGTSNHNNSNPGGGSGFFDLFP